MLTKQKKKRGGKISFQNGVDKVAQFLQINFYKMPFLFLWNRKIMQSCQISAINSINKINAKLPDFYLVFKIRDSDKLRHFFVLWCQGFFCSHVFFPCEDMHGKKIQRMSFKKKKFCDFLSEKEFLYYYFFFATLPWPKYGNPPKKEILIHLLLLRHANICFSSIPN